MDDLDRKIEEALNAEDRALVEEFVEPGPLGMWAGVYQGALRGVALFATFLTLALVAFAAYCGWRFFRASEAVEVTRWGFGALVLLVMVGYLKLWFWLRMESNRVLREVKRLELQMARRSAL
jgi:hypothetical protein